MYAARVSNSDLTAADVVLRDGSTVTLRHAKPDDAADLIEIQKQVVTENLANVDDHIDSLEECRQRIIAMGPAALWLVAEGNSHAVGTLRLIPPGPSFLRHIRNLFIDVHREWRGRGVGAAMIAAGAEWARHRGVEMIALSVLDSNPRAKSLYLRRGFTVTGHTPFLVKRPDGTYSHDTQMILRI